MTATQATVKYHYVINVCKKGDKHYTPEHDLKEISHDDIDTYDFKKGFIEFIQDPEYVHLYFDFDEIKNEDQLIETLKWIKSLESVFGRFVFNGYTNHAKPVYSRLRVIPDAKKVFSIHVCFPDTMIRASDLMDIVEQTKSVCKYKIHSMVDKSVYKLKTGSRQAFRHVYSDKTFGRYNPIAKGWIFNKDTTKNHANPARGEKASDYVITVRGTEKLIEKDEWLKVFPLNEEYVEKNQKQQYALDSDDDYEEEEQEGEQCPLPLHGEKQVKQTRNRPKVKTAKVEDLIVNNELIIFDEAEMDKFLSHFLHEYYNLIGALRPLLNSPYDKDFLAKHLIKWYGRRPHSNGIEGPVMNVIDKWYERENNNKWFFSLLKHLPVDIAKEYREKYCGRIDETININNSNWTLEDITNNEDITGEKYNIHDSARLINDLRGVIGFNKDRWYVKTTKDNQYYIQEATDEKVTKMLKHYKPFRDNTKISLAQIVMCHSDYFKYKGAEFSKDNKEGFINLFQGFKYEESTSDDFTPLADFLNHIKEVICNNDEAKYDYFMKWWANVIQNITVKNGTMPIIHGAQGSGKSFPVECFCELFGNYALMNVDDMDKVFGKFNGLLGRQLIIVINEPPEANEKFKYAGKIKSKLTQKKTVQELKGVDQIEVDSWANFILTTNNANPVQEEKGNRRFIYYATNNKYCGKEEYQQRVFKPIQPKKQGEYNKEFMSLLLHYMKTQIDVSDFDAEKLIREINNNTKTEFNEQLERQYLSLSSVDRFIVDNSDKFINGIKLSDIKVDGYKEAGLGKALINTCTNERVRVKETVDGETKTRQTRVYTLKPRDEIPDLYAIIDYKKYQDEHAKVIDETI